VHYIFVEPSRISSKYLEIRGHDQATTYAELGIHFCSF
jgi:hypothetical protein